MFVAWVAFWVYVVTAGTWLDAMTTSPADGGYCDIRWINPRDGDIETSETTCDDDAAIGSTVRVLAAPVPFDGEAGTAEDTWFVSLILGVPLGLGTLGYFGRRWWAPGAALPARVTPRPGVDLVKRGGPPPVPGRFEVDFAALAERARRREAEEQGRGCLLYTSPSPRDS